MSEWIDVCKLEKILPDSGVCALINEKQVAVFRWGQGDAVYALDNFDPFSKANVLSRGLVGDLKNQPVVASPIYKQHFNLENGTCLEDASVQLATYQTKVEEGLVKVRVC